MRRHTTAIVFFVLAVLTAVALALAVVTLRQVSDSNQDICIQVQALKGQIVASLKRSERALPANSYYIAHPSELLKAQHDIEHEIHRFQPSSC